MAKRDFYETLGVAKTASDAELKAAFRKAAMQCHPDRHPGDKQAEARFKELNEAYQHLSDAQKRAAYDRYGHAAFEQGGGGMNDGFATSMSDIFDDLFGDIMGRRGAQPVRARSAARTFATISRSRSRRPSTARPRPSSCRPRSTCEACAGSGAKAGSKPHDLQDLRRPRPGARAAGFFRDRAHLPDLPWPRPDDRQSLATAARGSGRVTRERTLSVNVPAGVEDGTRIRLDGRRRGGPARRGSGDLYIFLSIKPHPFFQRDGADLYCRVPISMVQAALGGEFSVSTLDGGDAKVRIPEGAQSGRQLKLRGKGMPILRSRDFGDLYIQPVVETPQNLTRRQRELLRSSTPNPRTRPIRKARASSPR